jgi:hypothetical protein
VDRSARLDDAVEGELDSPEARLPTVAHHDDRARLSMTPPGVAHGVAPTLIAEPVTSPSAGQFVRPGPARRAYLPLGLLPGNDHDGEASRAPKAMASLVTVSISLRPREDASGAPDWTGPPGRLCGMAFQARWPALLMPTRATRLC